MSIIDSFSGDYSFLSNFYPVDVEFDGEVLNKSMKLSQCTKQNSIGYQTAQIKKKTEQLIKELE